MENILVSIHCITYNHEEFIAEAIESFLMQKTDFKFEILIHDDASTDRTQEIIKEYELQYPTLIKPIYQLENQYSKGNSVNTINLNRAKGKYIAVCEGDDYWIDPYKLQKQVDYLENNPACRLCVHGGYIVTADEERRKGVKRSSKQNKIFTVEEVIAGGGGLFLTNSMLFQKESVIEIPKFIKISPITDYPLVIHLSLLGSVYYMDELMSAYRVGHSNSWTAKEFNNLENRKRHYTTIEGMLDELNIYTNYQYSDAINNTKKKSQLFLLLEQGKYHEAKNAEYKDIYLNLDFKRKLIIFMDQYTPYISKFLRYTKRRLINWITI